MIDYTLLGYALIAYFIFQLIRIQDIENNAFSEGVAHGHTIGYTDGRADIDEDMYEQGREAVFAELALANSCKTNT